MPTRPSGGPEREELVSEMQAAWAAIFRELLDNSLPAWLRLDLSMGQLKALLALVKDGPTTVGGIAAELGIGNPAASALIDGLVRHGLVERAEDPADRRRTITSASPRAIELVRQLRQGRREKVWRVLEALDDDELRALVRGLNVLAAALGPGARSDRAEAAARPGGRRASRRRAAEPV